jgi:MscS family membrane protein
MVVESIVSETYFGSTIPQYLLFFAILGTGALLGRTLSYLYVRRLRTKAEATETQLDDIILHSLGKPVVLLGIVLAAAVGREVLTPVEPMASILNASVAIPVIVSIAWIAVRLTDGIVDTYLVEYVEETESKLDDELVPIVSRLTNIAIVSIAGIVILDSIGYDVTAIIASLGVGGVAIAFASRKTMADLFGGAHILSTKPFLVDDVVDIDGTTGTVEEIGLRTTRIRDFDGRVRTIPNASIAEAEVTNVSTEPKRRIKTHIGLSYATTPAEMDEAIRLAEETARGVEGVDAEQTRALFWDYGEFAMQVRLDYRVDARADWMRVKDTVNRHVQRALAEAGIELALGSDRLRPPAMSD